MSLSDLAFYFLSFIAIVSAVFVISSQNPIYSVLSLIVTFFALAGLYILLNAQFLAAVHIIVYAGAIMVLFLYVIMMLNLNKEIEPHKSHKMKFAAVITGGMLLVVMAGVLKGVTTEMSGSAIVPGTGMVENLGRVLFDQFLLPFEISSILFLSAMVGAVMLGKKETGE